MPRRKVRDEDRQRARKACVPCKASKIRCDARLPCKNCMRKECQSSCHFLDASPPDQEHSSRPKTSRASKKKNNESVSASRVTHQPSPDQSHASSEHVSVAVPPTEQAPLPTPSASAHSPEVTHSRMLLSSKGEKMYIGKIASLSLLQFLRQTVRLHAGPTAFSDTASKNIMLEADMTDGDETNSNKCTRQEQYLLVDRFFEASSGLLDLYNKDEAFILVERSTNRKGEARLSTDEHGAVSLMLAIGAQCQGKQPSDLQHASTYFSQGRSLAFQGMLCDPSINMVRLFLLLAFYMLGACRRNAAFMYLGVAAKAACALGLHSKSHYPNLSPNERDLRHRVWKSLYVLDSLVNSILGRLSTLPPVEPESVLRQDPRPQKTALNSLDAAYGACTHIATIIPTISKSTELDSSFAENFLENLGRWREHALPAQHNHVPGHGSFPGLDGQESVLGTTHVACMYYFAVILVTRPFLLSCLTHKLRMRAVSGNNTPMAELSIGDSRVTKLAEACIDAASYMTQLCRGLLESESLLKNMCIMKAFMFAAGLLLGYSCFVDGKASESEDSFHAAQSVLQNFSDLSPQARHYCEILHDFGKAINKYQQLQQEQRRRSTNQYVRQIFSVNIDNRLNKDSNSRDYTGSGLDSVLGVVPDTGTGPSDTTTSPFGSGTLTNFLRDGSNFPGNLDLLDEEMSNLDTGMAYFPGMPFADTSTGNGSGNGNGNGNNDNNDDDTTTNMPFLWDNYNFDWQLFSAFPDEVNIGM